TPLAVRGEQLALSRVEVRAADGREIVFLQVHEWDGSKLAYAAHYDEDDLVDAEAELDERYVAGEGAEHREAVRAFTRSVGCLQAQDLDGLGECLSSDFVGVDHRELGWGTRDAEEFIALLESFRDLRHAYVSQAVQFTDRTALGTVRDDATSPDGVTASWVF